MKLILVKASILFMFFSVLQVYGYNEYYDSNSAESQTSPLNYTCNIKPNCLSELDNLLDKESNSSIYQYCRITKENIKLCCEHPMQCQETYGKGLSKELRSGSLKQVQSSGNNAVSCQLKNLAHLISSLSGVQSEMCSIGVENCEIDCDNKLKDLKDTFRKCFSIPINVSIDEVLKKSKNPLTNQACYKQMKEYADKYKNQSLDKKSLLRKKLKSKDIVKCKEIANSKTQSSLNNFAFSMCHQAQEQHQQQQKKKEQQKKAKQRKEQQKKAKQERAKQKQQYQKKQQQQRAKQQRKVKQQYQKKQQQKQKRAKQQRKVKQQQRAKQQRKVKQQQKQKRAKQQRKVKQQQQRAKQNKQAGNQSSKATRSKKSLSSSALLGAGALGVTALSDMPRKTSQNKKAQANTNKKNQKSLRKSNKLPSSSQSRTLSSATSLVESTKGLKFTQSSYSQSAECSINMPKILSAVVYQSVKAPQIESMDKQEERPYNDYDLVAGKPAGVLIELDRTNMDTKKTFRLELDVPGVNQWQQLCFHKPLKGKMHMDGLNQNIDHCRFNQDNLIKQGSFKFIPLPMKKIRVSDGEGNLQIKVMLFPENKSCLIQKDFRIKIQKTPDLKLGFTRIDSVNKCKGYSSSSLQTVEGFAGSKEVTRYIPSMYPINKITTVIQIDAAGSCDNTPGPTQHALSKGLLRDINTLERHRKQYKADKFIAIAPEDYFLFHNRVDGDGYALAGFVILPYWQYWTFLWPFNSRPYEGRFVGGNWNITFVLDSRKNKGTLAHELAHTLGQVKEQYFKRTGTESCQEFNDQSKVRCDKQKIKIGLDSWGNGSRFQFVEDKWSIMNNKSDILGQWIDRDSYQKIFSALLNLGAVIPAKDKIFGRSIASDDENPQSSSSEKIIITGFYDTEQDKFILPNQEILKTDLTTPSFSAEKYENVPTLTIKLDRANDPVKEIKRPAFKMGMRTIYKDRPSETTTLDLSLITAAFELPKDTGTDYLTIKILNPNGDPLYEAPVIRKRDEE